MSDDADSIISGFLSTPAGTAAFAGLAVLCFGACFFYSVFRSTLTEATIGAQKRQAENGSGKASKALRLISCQSRHLRRAGCGFAVNFALAVISAVCAFSPMLAKTIKEAGLNGIASAGISAAAVFLLSACLGYGLFSVLPSRLGLAGADERLPKIAGAYSVLSLPAAPLDKLSAFLAGIVLRILGKSAKSPSDVLTEEEILQMVDEGEESGIIEGNTKDMIENVFDFDDTKVGEIMTHRRDIVAVSDDASVTDVAQAAIKSGKSRIPVYHDDIDDIVGIIHVKDLLRYIGKEFPVDSIDRGIIKEAVFVPESKCCSEMFEYMTENKTQIAVVVDEFGGTGGLITMEDLVESIVGSIQDEYDNEDEEIHQLDERSFTVDGQAPLDEISELTGLDLSADENDTVAGIMLDRMGHIPKSGEHPSVMINGIRFTVQEVSGQRISKVLIVLPESAAKTAIDN